MAKGHCERSEKQKSGEVREVAVLFDRGEKEG